MNTINTLKLRKALYEAKDNEGINTINHILVLLHLKERENDGINYSIPGNITQYLRLGYNTLTGVIDVMEKNDLIYRLTDSQANELGVIGGRRSRPIGLTENGSRAINNILAELT